MSYLHAHRILHRDLKPENILVEHRPPPIRSWFARTPAPEAAQTRPFQLDGAAVAHTPEASVHPGEEVSPAQMLFPKAEDTLELSDIAELFAPAFRGRDHLVADCLNGYGAPVVVGADGRGASPRPRHRLRILPAHDPGLPGAPGAVPLSPQGALRRTTRARRMRSSLENAAR